MDRWSGCGVGRTSRLVALLASRSGTCRPPERSAELADPHRDGEGIEDNSADAEKSASQSLTGCKPDIHDIAAELALAGAEGNPIEGQRKAGDHQRRQQASPFFVFRRQAQQNSGEYEHQA